MWKSLYFIWPMTILVFFYYHLPKQTITHKIILNSINLFRKILYDNCSSRFTPNSIYQTSLDGWMLNAKYNKHEEWCLSDFWTLKCCSESKFHFLLLQKLIHDGQNKSQRPVKRGCSWISRNFFFGLISPCWSKWSLSTT